jgi:hypothetical protein
MVVPDSVKREDAETVAENIKPLRKIRGIRIAKCLISKTASNG